MKIRAGFVSNSSSSSFVVVLPENWLESVDYEKRMVMKISHWIILKGY